MINKTLFKTIVKISLLSLILAMSMFQFSILPAQAAALTSMSDTMTRLKINEKADHTVKWTLPSGVTFDANDKARVDFPAAFVTAGTWVTGDFTFNDGTARTIVGVGNNVDPTCTAGANNVAVKIIPADDQFEIWACSTYTSSGAGAIVTFTIDGTDVDGTLTNPGSAGSNTINLVGDDKGNGFDTDDDTGSLAVGIVDNDQVTITATVDPTLTFAIYKSGTSTPTSYCWRDDANMGFGSIVGGSSTVDTCKYDIYTSTNAVNGYAATITPTNDGTGCHNYALNQEGVFLCDYFYEDPEIDQTVTASRTTNSEYGVGSSDSDMGGGGEEVPYEATCTEDSSVSAAKITESGGLWPLTKRVAEATSPTTETATICHAAAGSPIQPAAGTYIQVVTLISTGRF